MQKIKTLLLLLITGGLFMVGAQAQVCTPDPTPTAPGLYPANLPAGCINQAYDESATIVIPLDTMVSTPLGMITLPIDSIVLIGLSGLHTGLSYQCNPASCVFPGNSRGCVNIAGTPTQMGTRTVKVIADVFVTAPIVGSTSIRDSSFTVQFTVGSPITVSITGPTAVCSGDTITLDAGAGYDSYLWSNGDTTQTIRVAASGSFGVRVTSGACADSVGTTVTSSPAPSLNPSSMDATCGQSNGSAMVIATGTGPFSFSWNTGQTNTGVASNLSNISSGTYSVTVTDANGCSASESFNISDVGGAQLDSLNKTDIACAGDNNGSISTFFSGGTTPYTYSWSNGASTSTLSSLAAGSYTLTLTDANNCVTSISVTITEPSALDLTAGFQSDPLCANGMDGSATVGATGGVQPYTYSWNNGSTGTSLSMLSAGTYTAFVTDGNGCTDSVSVILTDPAAISIAESLSDPRCFEGNTGSIDLTVSGGTPAYTYQWNTTPPQTGATANNLTAGTYSCTVTDNNGCTETYSGTLNEPPALLIELDSVDATAGQMNGQAWVTASGGTPPYTYLWSTGATTDTIQNLFAGNYTLTVTDANGCIAEGAVTVVENANSLEDELAAGINRWEMFPNPTEGQLSLRLRFASFEQAELKVYDLTGRQVKSFQLEGAQWEGEVDLSEAAPGLYLFELRTAQGRALRKLLKQ
jgi:hypothetical protein